MKKINEEKEKQHKIEVLKECLEFELTPGYHTFSLCRCGRAGCRGFVCFKCLKDDLRKLTKPEVDRNKDKIILYRMEVEKDKRIVNEQLVKGTIGNMTIAENVCQQAISMFDFIHGV